MTQPGSWAPAQRSSHHLPSRGNESSISKNGTGSPGWGWMSLLPFQLFLCRLQLWCFHSALCCRLLLGVTAEPGSALHQLGKEVQPDPSSQVCPWAKKSLTQQGGCELRECGILMYLGFLKKAERFLASTCQITQV